MSNTENKTLTFEAINYVTIPIWEYKELVTKVARYELLQEQERQHQAEMEAFRASLPQVTVTKTEPGDTDKKVPAKKAANPAISTEITEK